MNTLLIILSCLIWLETCWYYREMSEGGFYSSHFRGSHLCERNSLQTGSAFVHYSVRTPDLVCVVVYVCVFLNEGWGREWSTSLQGTANAPGKHLKSPLFCFWSRVGTQRLEMTNWDKERSLCVFGNLGCRYQREISEKERVSICRNITWNKQQLADKLAV